LKHSLVHCEGNAADAGKLLSNVDNGTVQEYALKAIVHATLGQEQGSVSEIK